MGDSSDSDSSSSSSDDEEMSESVDTTEMDRLEMQVSFCTTSLHQYSLAESKSICVWGSR